MSYANLPALTPEELGALEEVLSFQLKLQSPKGAAVPPRVNTAILRHLLKTVQEAQARTERRQVRENAARVPAKDLQAAFADEARQAMGAPTREYVETFKGERVVVSFNNTSGSITGMCTDVDANFIYIGRDAFPLRSLQSIVFYEPPRRLPNLLEEPYPQQEHTEP